MRRKSFAEDRCPVARTLDRVGDPWSMLILRDAGFGSTRFDQFEASLGIAPNMLSRRLETLVEAGMLERQLYSVNASNTCSRVAAIARPCRSQTPLPQTPRPMIQPASCPPPSVTRPHRS
jgi:hypothetical protein